MGFNVCVNVGLIVGVNIGVNVGVNLKSTRTIIYNYSLV